MKFETKLFKQLRNYKYYDKRVYIKTMKATLSQECLFFDNLI